MTTLNIAVIGAAGRMGNAIIRYALASPAMHIVAAVEQKGHPHIGKDACLMAATPACGVLLTDDMNVALRADVLIDFSAHTVVPTTIRLAADNRKPVILGTTGLDTAETKAVHEAAARIPVVWAPNMSLGVNLLFSMVRKAASVLGMNYIVEIEETHHIHKKDAPSGTALRLGEKVAEGRGQEFPSVMLHNPAEPARKCGAGRIVIRSHRIGEVVGDHTVSFESEGERIELIHHAWTREAFAQGALRAAQWVIGRPPRLYDMQDVLGL